MQKLLYAFLCLIFISSFSLSQDEGMGMDEETKAWMEYATPGAMHKMMAKQVGEWNISNTMWMKPDTEPMVSEGTATFEMLMGGRYLRANYKGAIMGMPFEGSNLQGYDNATGEFNNIWIDNFGTGFMIGKGKYDEASKTINTTGTFIDPLTKTEKTYREIFKIESDDKLVMEMFMNEDGNEFKNMEIVFTRK